MAIITIKDIAKQLKLSPSTVSRALRDHPDISRPTKNRVISLAQKLDYHPDTIAQSLQTKKTKTIGVIVPEIKQPFFASVINGIEKVAYAAGYTIIVCQSNETFDREVLYTRTLRTLSQKRGIRSAPMGSLLGCYSGFSRLRQGFKSPWGRQSIQ